MRLKDYNKLKVGDEVKITQKYRKWMKEVAFEFCIHKGGPVHESQLEDYFMYAALGVGCPYKAVIDRLSADVGNKTPGARVIVTIGDIQSGSYYEYKHLSPVRKRKKKR